MLARWVRRSWPRGLAAVRSTQLAPGSRHFRSFLGVDKSNKNDSKEEGGVPLSGPQTPPDLPPKPASHVDRKQEEAEWRQWFDLDISSWVTSVTNEKQKPSNVPEVEDPSSPSSSSSTSFSPSSTSSTPLPDSAMERIEELVDSAQEYSSADFGASIEEGFGDLQNAMSKQISTFMNEVEAEGQIQDFAQQVDEAKRVLRFPEIAEVMERWKIRDAPSWLEEQLQSLSAKGDESMKALRFPLLHSNIEAMRVLASTVSHVQEIMNSNVHRQAPLKKVFAGLLALAWRGKTNREPIEYDSSPPPSYVASSASSSRAKSSSFFSALRTRLSGTTEPEPVRNQTALDREMQTFLVLSDIVAGGYFPPVLESLDRAEWQIVRNHSKSDFLLRAHILAVNHEERRLCLSCRGTQELVDVLVDVSVEPASFRDGFVHRGVLESARRLHSHIKNDLTRLVSLFPDYKLTLCGHSLGGGVASILGFLLRDDGFDVEVYTYGTMSVLSPNLAKIADDFAVSLVLGNDIIPSISLASVIELHNAAVSTPMSQRTLLDVLDHSVDIRSKLQDANNRLSSMFDSLGLKGEATRKLRLLTGASEADEERKDLAIEISNLSEVELELERVLQQEVEVPPTEQAAPETALPDTIMSDVDPRHLLCPAGRTIHFEHIDGLGYPLVKEVPREYYRNISLTKDATMLTDHLIRSYRDALSYSVEDQRSSPC